MGVGSFSLHFVVILLEVSRVVEDFVVLWVVILLGRLGVLIALGEVNECVVIGGGVVGLEEEGNDEGF